ncbi:hypothetical protein BKA61DRAFT_581883 [Leptodontidium sp. MPI-SDFR-AT-0119]|nr:hypothetical protein BKA61DRAFT_581883 [Leptodontidium sp. MPI-SDFR-AT-0119]
MPPTSRLALDNWGWRVQLVIPERIRKKRTTRASSCWGISHSNLIPSSCDDDLGPYYVDLLTSHVVLLPSSYRNRTRTTFLACLSVVSAAYGLILKSRTQTWAGLVSGTAKITINFCGNCIIAIGLTDPVCSTEFYGKVAILLRRDKSPWMSAL